MKKILFSLIGLFIFAAFTSGIEAQGVDGVYTKHITSKRKPLPFQFIREADVMWSKVLIRRVNLTEKRNLSLYFPTEEMEDRKSLIQLMMWGIKNKSLTPFATEEFISQYTLNEIDQRFGAGIDTTYDIDPETGETLPIITKKPADISEVKELLIKERWIFDKQRSVMECRIIGLCPIRIFYRDDDLDQEDMRQKKLFWVFFPEARNIFASQPIYNAENQSQEISFDDYFVKRMFDGYIFSQSNVFNNRRIEAYKTGLDVLLESEKIKDDIFSYEHELWEF
ncbi:MAG: gliding motility protein GldN [Bacteroidales bacterium]|nr:gliding motility protein GldN [Bacteroidales bacterium]